MNQATADGVWILSLVGLSILFNVMMELVMWVNQVISIIDYKGTLQAMYRTHHPGSLLNSMFLLLLMMNGKRLNSKST